MGDEDRQKTNDNRENEISKKISFDSRDVYQRNSSSTQNERSGDSSLKRKLSTDEVAPQSVKHRRHSENDLSDFLNATGARAPFVIIDDLHEEESSSQVNRWRTEAASSSSSSDSLDELVKNLPFVNKNYVNREVLVVKTSSEAVIGNDVEKIFESFQEIEVYFNDITRVTNSNYDDHVVNYICNNYRFTFKSDLKRICKKYNFHLMPILRELYNEGDVEAVRQSQRQLLDMPQPRDEMFYLELKYIGLRENIDTCNQSEIDEVLEQFSDMTKNLITCDCCFEENLTRDDMLACVDGHEFCKSCIRHLVKVNVGLEKFGFRCLNGYCEREFSLYTLQLALELTVFSSLVSEVKKRNILIAGIADVVTCPLCLTNMMSTDRNDMLVNCTNPLCLKTTCRLCKGLNHYPAACGEEELWDPYIDYDNMP